MAKNRAKGAVRVSPVGAPTRALRAGSQRRVFVVVVAIGAILMGLFALHSMAGSHGGSAASSAVVSLSHEHVDTAATSIAATSGAATVTAVVVASAAFIAATGPVAECDTNCVMDCVGMALACLALAIVTAMGLLARSPALFHRLIERGRSMTGHVVNVKNHVYLPSLTVLSISRT